MLAAEGAGQLEGPDVRSGEAEHPVCGDHVQVDCRLQDDLIVALAWRAQGCPACMAVAAAAPQALLNLPISQAAHNLHQRLQDLGGLASTEQHAERLFLRALSQATLDPHSP